MKELSKFFAAPSRKLLMHKELKPINWYLIKAKARVWRQDWHDFLSQRTRCFLIAWKYSLGKVVYRASPFRTLFYARKNALYFLPIPV